MHANEEEIFMKKRFFAVLLVFILILSNLSIYAVAVPPITDFTPYELKAELMEVDDLHPYGSVELTFKINDLISDSSGDAYAVLVEKKIGNAEWIEVSYERASYYLDNYSIGTDQYRFEQLWTEDTEFKDNILVSYRVRVSINDSTLSPYDYSGYSNIATVGIKASPWALVEIKEALDYGIVPDSVKDDYTKNITREEFAELAVKVFETYEGTQATPISPNPFTDSSNSSVLKAYKLGIVNGISATTFAPKNLTTREEIAAMLYRTIKAIEPTTDFSTNGSPTFLDSSKVKPWFVENVKFMSLHEFILGSNNYFNPSNSCTREAAILIAVRVYKAYKNK